MESESSNLRWLAAAACLVGALAWVWMGAPLPDMRWLNVGGNGPSQDDLDVGLPEIELGLPDEPGFLPTAEAANNAPDDRAETRRGTNRTSADTDVTSAGGTSADAPPFWSSERDAPPPTTRGPQFKKASLQSAVGRIDRPPGTEADHRTAPTRSKTAPATDHCAQLEKRCWDLGTVNMQLKATGGAERLYDFRCEVRVPGNDRLLRYFESTGRTPEAVMEKVVAYAEEWQIRQARAAKAKAAKTRSASRSAAPRR
ncbi:MAG: hypothetical protein HYS13_22160 [Planctomycetia bacterium]|nr:hypothetical protein [Planctomycetia bacterium]